ncbi:MAG TPA: GNAT family N-acetyltransferase [Streptosporangiaceae bacterium]
MPDAAEVRELSAAQFIAELDTLTWIYAHAMAAPAAELHGRLAIMERHAGHPGFRSLVAVPHLPGAPQLPGAPHSSGAGHGSGATASPAAGPVGFAYGFHGAPGQWWHDVVYGTLAAERGRAAADWWLGDCFEVAEVHVHPEHQGRGAGRAMIDRLTTGLRERTAVLSTPHGHTRAHRLYRSLGFGGLLPSFSFPGASSSYAIMGAVLPLPGARSAAARSASPSHR